MSTRDYFISVTSIDPIRAAIASHDDKLVKALADKYAAAYDAADLADKDVRDDIEEHRMIAESMIKCESPPKKEPGCWTHLIEDLAERLGLEPSDSLPFNEGWKHSYVWKAYRKTMDRHVSRQSRRSLGHLENGRPLRGKRIDYDGCLFAWLSADEVNELRASLSQEDSNAIADTDLVDFHQTLVQSLIIVSGQRRDLFMGAG